VVRSRLRNLSNAERVLVVVFLATLPLVNPLIRGDGVGYYAYARSLLIDGDLRFENEWLAANASFVRSVADASGQIRPDQYTPTGYVANHFTVGPALLWAPALVATHGFVLGARALGASIPADGYSWPYRVAMALTTALCGFTALWLAYHVARSYAPEKPALLATLGIWFGSALPVYMYLNPSWSHAHSAFAVALFLWYWLRTRGRRTAAQWIILGLLGSLMMNIYYPNALLLLLPGLEALSAYGRVLRARAGQIARALAARHAAFGASLLTGLAPTLWTRKVIYGSLLATGYQSLREWCWPRPWLAEVLISANHGLLSWTPILLPALAGLAWVVGRDRETGLYVIAVCAAFTYLIAAYPTWHGVSSFGNRFFVSLTPIFVIGLAALLARAAPAGPLPAVVIALLVAWNLGLVFQWGTNMIPNRGPVDWRQVARNQLLVPGRALTVAAAYATDRSTLLARIQQEDLREVEQWRSPTPPCR